MADQTVRLIVESLEERLALTADALIHLIEAHHQFGYDGRGYTVAVLDTGIDYRNPALGGTFGQADSRVIDGWDFVDGRSGDYVEGDSTPGPDPDPLDEAGHGTNIAGIIGSSEPDCMGVAPGVNFVSLRVLDANDNGSWDWVAQALDWVKRHQEQYHIVAVNMSLGSGNYLSTPAIPDVSSRINQLTQLGVTIVSAAGNNFFGYDSQPGMQFPAVIPNVISVGAVYDSDVGSQTHDDGSIDYSTAPDRIAAFSQRSSALDLLAPGFDVVNAAQSPDGNAYFSGYTGTSQAAAFVTGAVVLVRQALDLAGRSDLADPADILKILQQTGVQVFDGDDEADNVVNTQRSYARLDLLAALTAATASGSQAPDVGSPAPFESWRMEGWTPFGGAAATNFLYAFLAQTSAARWNVQDVADVSGRTANDVDSMNAQARLADVSLPPWSVWYLINASGPGSTSLVASGTDAMNPAAVGSSSTQPLEGPLTTPAPPADDSATARPDSPSEPTASRSDRPPLRESSYTFSTTSRNAARRS